MATGPAAHKVKRLADGHHNAEIEIHPKALALGAGNLPQYVGDIGLGALIKLHIGMNRKGVVTLDARAFPSAIRLHTAAIDAEAIGLANGASDRTEARFNLLDCHIAHGMTPFPDLICACMVAGENRV
jgi:hypothetical protein